MFFFIHEIVLFVLLHIDCFFFFLSYLKKDSAHLITSPTMCRCLPKANSQPQSPPRGLTLRTTAAPPHCSPSLNLSSSCKECVKSFQSPEIYFFSQRCGRDISAAATPARRANVQERCARPFLLITAVQRDPSATKRYAKQ